MSDLQPDYDYRRRREALGLSRRDLAELADMDASTVALVENGWRPRRGVSLAKLEKALTKREEANDASG